MTKYYLITDVVVAVTKIKEQIMEKFDTSKRDPIALIQIDDLKEVEKAIDLFYNKKETTTILLIDKIKSICYVYKAKGTMTDVRDILSSYIDPIYKTLSGEDLLLEKIEDLRDYMKIKTYQPDSVA